MNISALSFAELHKFFSPAHLCKVTAEYHTALRQQWDFVNPDKPHQFMVSKAEALFPKLAALYKPQLELMTSPDVANRLRMLADRTKVPFWDGTLHNIRTCDYRCLDEKHDAYGLALLCKHFSGISGAPAHIRHAPGAFLVQAETTAEGVAIMSYRSGMMLFDIQSFCRSFALDFEAIFWWLAYTSTPPLLLNKVNPIRRCLNTPDVTDHANALIH